MAEDRRERRLTRSPFVGAGRPYWAAFDGVRGFAVLAVVLFHTGRHPFKDGFVGVDVFFVLSGFLITSLLLRELRSPPKGAKIPEFYLRRVLRILPALVVVCAACVLGSAVVGQHFTAVAEGAVATLLGVANIWIYSGHNTQLLQQMWTLSLEEQFYLLWPLLLVVAFYAKRPLRLVILVVCLASWAALILVPLHGTANTVRYSYVRGAGLALGCLLAFALPWVQRRVPAVVLRTACVLAAVFLVVTALFPVFPSAWFSSWHVSLGALVSVPLIAGLVAAPPVLLSRGLTSGFSRWLGGRSYAIYLWHFPLLSLAINHAQHVPLAAREVAAIAATFIAAELSWRLVEERFLRRKQRHEPTVAPG